MIIESNLESISGYELVREIRTINIDIPIILIADDREILGVAQDMYFINEVLPTPWQPAYLWTRINRIVLKEDI